MKRGKKRPKKSTEKEKKERDTIKSAKKRKKKRKNTGQSNKAKKRKTKGETKESKVKRKREEKTRNSRMFHMKHSAVSTPGRKRQKTPPKPQKSAIQCDSPRPILCVGKEFRKDLLKKKTKRGENGKIKRQNRAEKGEITKRRILLARCAKTVGEQRFLRETRDTNRR